MGERRTVAGIGGQRRARPAGAPVGGHPLLRLQRAAGNRAVAAALQEGGAPVQRFGLEDLGRVGLGLGLALLGIDTTPKPSIKRPTAHPNVWVREVPDGTPHRGMGDGEVDLKESSKLRGSYGVTGSTIVVHYTIRPTKDGRCVALVVYPELSTTIELRPASGFNAIDDFAPYYDELQTKFGGDRDRYARTKAMVRSGTETLFGNFATRDGTLYHETLHAAVQRLDAKRRERVLYAEASGLVADKPEEARQLLVEAVDRTWKGFPDDKGVDHVTIYERQCKEHIEAYERAHPPA